MLKQPVVPITSTLGQITESSEISYGISNALVPL